ncbi:centrosomal protein of 78 kDa-like isoform X4 [Portunus trituberculatus]|uniref:centrosomal protein of 78 kDa-like isoform X4 n=1 Tax=Portunus trituberculatus TaxID=210409 RepID=UPI001E1CC0D4|nr:centrosomal protein of 78 kDa-like isoform X4 [Portunus trituberculatus]
MARMTEKPELLGETLTRHYRLSCELLGSYPVPHFTHQLSRGSLDLHLDTVDLDHLEVLCHTLKNKVSPSSLRISVPKANEVSAVVARVVERAVEGVGVCVVASLTLTLLSLDGVRLAGRILKLLCEGLRKARTVKSLVMRNCSLGDSGTESVCQAVKNVPSITHLSLVNCGVAERGATAVACLIKHQRLNRDSAMWQDTLRQRQPHLDGMKGLRRLTLNINPALGDQGVAAITEALTEDLWIKALDLQHCGVGTEGGASVQALLHANQTLEVVDLRNNPFLPDTVVGQLASLLQGRCSEVSSQYSWLRTSELEEKEEAVLGDGYRQGGKPGYRGSGRIMKTRKGKQVPHVHPSKRPTPPSQLGVPWRVEHRLEGLAAGAMVKGYSREWEGGGEAKPLSNEPVPEADIKKMRKKLQLYRKKYQKEREQRKKLEHKLSHIQRQLQGLHTLDEATLTHIEECFLKFHIFLSMMHHSGEDSLSSSSGGVSPSYHLPMEPSKTQTHPDSMLLSGNLSFLPSSTIPIPVVIHQPSSPDSQQQPIPALHTSDCRQGGDGMLEKVVCESKLSNKRKKEKLNATRPEKNFVGQGHTSGSEVQERNDTGVTSEIMISSQSRNVSSSSTHGQLANKEDVGEETMLDRDMDEGVTTKIKNSKCKSEDLSNKGSDSVAYSSPLKEKEIQKRTQFNGNTHQDIGDFKKTAKEQKLIISSSSDYVAVRVESGTKENKGINEEWNNEKTDEHANGIYGKRILSVREDEELETEVQSQELSFLNKVMEIHTPQGLLEGNWHEEEKSEKEMLYLKPESQGSEKSQSPITLKNKISKEGQLLQKTPSSHLYQECPTPNDERAEEPLYQHILDYQESSGSSSPSSQSFSSQSPPSQSPRKAHPIPRCQLPQRSKSPQKQSPKKSRSSRNKPLGIQGNEVSETDDDKMRNLSVWLQGRVQGRGTTSSSSSVSISEHLQHSHTSWTKRKVCQEERAKEEEEEDGEMEELPGGSEIDLSDCEDLSLSGLTLSNTSIPEDVNTGGEEDF